MNGVAICAGIGGLELGLRLAIPTYRTVCYVERESFAASVIVARMEDKTLDLAPVYDDLESFDGSAWRGKVDIVSAGFPCQPHSYAGPRKGTEDERWIWDGIVNIIRKVGPSIVLMENVPGLLSSGFDRVLGNLAQMGFNAEWGCFSAEACGLPHKRERVFILAYSTSDIWGALWNERQEALNGASNKAMGNAKSQRIKQGSVSSRTKQEKPRIASPSRDMADTDSTVRGQEVPLRKSKERTTTGRTGQGIIPPGPNDTAAWQQIIKINPTLKPALRGVASRTPDELEQSPMSFRRDRLQALGNAVVPITAAVALLTLMDRIDDTDQP